MELNNFLYFNVKYETLDDGYTATIEDLETDDYYFTQGNTLEDVQNMAKSCIVDMFKAEIALKRKVPISRAYEHGNYNLKLDYDLALKFMLNNLMYDLKITKTELANKLNISFANLSNKLKLNKTTSLNDLARMFEVLGVPLKISA